MIAGSITTVLTRIPRRVECQSTRLQDTSRIPTEQVTPVTAEVPDATDSPNNEFERVKENEGQFFGVRDVLEQLTQKVAIPRDEGRLAEEAVLTPEL